MTTCNKSNNDCIHFASLDPGCVRYLCWSFEASCVVGDLFTTRDQLMNSTLSDDTADTSLSEPSFAFSADEHGDSAAASSFDTSLSLFTAKDVSPAVPSPAKCLKRKRPASDRYLPARLPSLSATYKILPVTRDQAKTQEPVVRCKQKKSRKRRRIEVVEEIVRM